jgi:hypothetical protein
MLALITYSQKGRPFIMRLHQPSHPVLIKPSPSNFPQADLNEAARAADATACIRGKRHELFPNCMVLTD